MVILTRGFLYGCQTRLFLASFFECVNATGIIKKDDSITSIEKAVVVIVWFLARVDR